MKSVTWLLGSCESEQGKRSGRWLTERSENALFAGTTGAGITSVLLVAVDTAVDDEATASSPHLKKSHPPVAHFRNVRPLLTFSFVTVRSIETSPQSQQTSPELLVFVLLLGPA